MRLRLLLGLAAGAVLAVVLACGKASSGNEILVGEYGSLTGGIATFGISTRDGSQQAFDEINAAGGVLGKKIKLMVEDDQSKPEEVGTVVTKLINQGHVSSMLGHVASSYSLAAAPICQASKIPMITPSSTNPARDPDRRLHLPRLLHGQLPGRRDGEVRVGHAESQARRDPRGHPQRLLRRPPGRLPRAVQEPWRPDRRGAVLLAGRLGFPRAADPDQVDEPGRHLCARLLHGSRHDRPPGEGARPERAAPRRRRLGLAEALGDRRDGAERLLLLRPLLDGRPLARSSRSS